MSSIKKILSILCIILLFSSSGYADPNTQPSGTAMDDTTTVICNIIKYIWGIGGPLMTVVFIGAALLAIFGRMPWPALFALGMFCGVFFGAKAIIMKVMPNISSNMLVMQQCGN
ncbi:TrbC/VirB2 family protein [Wolbachia endosymbiont of Ctenocephalides felis wCfeT]|uniref:TrbC/VirB2 family protein n=1 Tax=Wolbachia endosymbiont of Ctenocephalides felis wCfeT TaxID=2732593 RepID=UPI001446D5D2|nr:TrbC/VirB2 family protein [Wolbachia endosymbiont of Ctenocephalides felis wCfeT]